MILFMQKTFWEACVSSLRLLSIEFLKENKSSKFTVLVVYFEDSTRKCTLKTANSLQSWLDLQTLKQVWVEACQWSEEQTLLFLCENAAVSINYYFVINSHVGLFCLLAFTWWPTGALETNAAGLKFSDYNIHCEFL